MEMKTGIAPLNVKGQVFGYMYGSYLESWTVSDPKPLGGENQVCRFLLYKKTYDLIIYPAVEKNEEDLEDKSYVEV